MADRTSDDAFREIQLGGKQLVFLFMVATVFSVVVFLCGVFVGRGVRAERAPVATEIAGSTAVTTPDAVAQPETAPPPAGSDPTTAPPPPAVDELSYFNRLEKSSGTTEELKAPAPSPAATRAAADAAPPAPKKESSAGNAKASSAAAGAKEPPVAASVKEPPLAGNANDISAATANVKEAPVASATEPAAASTSSSGEPAGTGFALQITALREKSEAESIARRLSSKGYSAYVLTPAKGTPSVYRVRIGKFKTRREAEAMATRLQKEEQFTPWITR